MLTTKDNPYDPYTQYDQWLDWDRSNGYYTNELLARWANVSLDMTDDEMEPLINDAMQIIVENDLAENYKII